MRRGRLSILRRAALIPPIIVEELKKIIVPGISELQVAKYIKKRIKQLGGKKPSFRLPFYFDRAAEFLQWALP